MANSKLHIICGNCGCNNMWTWNIHIEHDPYLEDVFIKCGNCSTLHSLDEKIERDKENELD